jgi:RecA-family ATPase
MSIASNYSARSLRNHSEGPDSSAANDCPPSVRAEYEGAVGQWRQRDAHARKFSLPRPPEPQLVDFLAANGGDASDDEVLRADRQPTTRAVPANDNLPEAAKVQGQITEGNVVQLPLNGSPGLATDIGVATKLNGGQPPAADIGDAKPANAVTLPLYNKEMARLQLNILDPNATQFTFQFFTDNKYATEAEKKTAARTIHGTLDEVWPMVLASNTPQQRVGVYVTINETDGKGRRKAENIVRIRALFVDADSNETVEHCEKTFATTGVTPSMVVSTGRGRHFYFLLDDLPLDKFTTLQKRLIAKLGTDAAVHDLPRVLRLAGTLHLKDPANLRPITLHNQQGDAARRYRLADLVTKLGLSLDAVPELKPAAANIDAKLYVDPSMAGQGSSALFKGKGIESLSEGLKDYWLDKLTPEQRDVVVHYMLSVIAEKTKWLELSDNGGNNGVYYKLATALAVFDSPKGEDYFVEFASKVKDADPQETLRAFFSRCKKDADGRITPGTLIHLAREAGVDLSLLRKLVESKSAAPEEAAQATAAELPPLTFINLSKWDNEPLPEREWAVPNRIPLRHTGLFSGEGGAGKSYIALHLCVAHVLNRTWLHSMPTPGPAIFVDAEDDENEIHIRLGSVLKHYDASFADAVKGGLHLLSFVGRDAVLATASRNNKVEPTPLYGRLLQAAGDIKPKMICIASSANVFAGSEIDRNQVQQFVSLLTGIAQVANGSVQLISHPSLTGINSGSGISGSTQWHNAVRARSYLKGVKAEDCEQSDSDLRELTFMKNQYGRTDDVVVLRYQHGMFLPESGVLSLDKAKQMEIAKDVFLTLLDRFNVANRTVSHNPGRNYAPALFAQEDEAKTAGLNKKLLDNAMKQLFRDNKIWNEPCGKPSRPAYRIARGMNPAIKQPA